MIKKKASKLEDLTEPPLEEKKKKKKLILTKNYEAGKDVQSEYVNTLRKELYSPRAELSYCSIVKPAFFAGSSVPRYKVVLAFSKDNESHVAFLKELEDIADVEQIGTVGRLDTRGRILISFQGREKPEIKSILADNEKIEIELDHDLPSGIPTSVKFELRKYFDRYQQRSAFSFKPLEIYFYLDNETKDTLKLED